MKSFTIRLSARAIVRTSIEVQAETQEQAEQLAVSLAKDGEALWKYDGADDDTIEVD